MVRPGESDTRTGNQAERAGGGAPMPERMGRPALPADPGVLQAVASSLGLLEGQKGVVGLTLQATRNDHLQVRRPLAALAACLHEMRADAMADLRRAIFGAVADNGETHAALRPVEPDPALAGVTVNAEQGLYVLPFPGGYTCLGFDVALRQARAVAEWAGVPAPDPARAGTLAGYADYLRAMAAARAKHDRTGERCPAELTPQLVGLEGRRVEVVDADGRTRRFKVGRSTGWLPCHLELHNARSVGGGPVMGAPFRSVRVVA